MNPALLAAAALFTAAAAPTVMAQSHLIEGNASSQVRVVIYEDLQCSDCAVFRKMLDEKLLPKYASKVAFEHRDFPLVKHAWAKRAAIASRFFQENRPEIAVLWRRETMAAQAQITPEKFAEHLTSFARKYGIDPAKATAALFEKKYVDLVEKDYEEGVARGIARTPTALVNGEPFVETFTLEEISKSIDAQLSALSGGPNK